MNQLTRFVSLNELNFSPAARRRDPETSHEAAGKAASFAVSHRNRIMAALTGPSTIKELAARSGLDHVAVARRMIELERLGLACRILTGTNDRGHSVYEKRDGCALWRRA